MFLGALFNLLLVLLYNELLNTLSFTSVLLYTTYYFVIIFVKIRNALLTQDMINTLGQKTFSWFDFLNYYKIIPTSTNSHFGILKFLDINTNHEFKNITFFLNAEDTNIASQLFFRFQAGKQHILNFLLGFFSS